MGRSKRERRDDYFLLKRKMQDLLFHILIKEDDYVGIPTLISEFSKLKVAT